MSSVREASQAETTISSITVFCVGLLIDSLLERRGAAGSVSYSGAD